MYNSPQEFLLMEFAMERAVTQRKDHWHKNTKRIERGIFVHANY